MNFSEENKRRFEIVPPEGCTKKEPCKALWFEYLFEDFPPEYLERKIGRGRDAMEAGCVVCEKDCILKKKSS